MTFPTQAAGIGGGTDFQTKTPAYFAGSLNTATLATLLTVNGRGILTSISVAVGSGSSVRVRITIDGVIVADDSSMFNGFNGPIPPMTFIWGFKRSLLIESSQSPASFTSYKVAYMLG